MSGTWLDFCVVRRGPASKCGYPGVSRRTPAQIEGEVDHSMEGPLRAALGELDKLTRMASWTFSVPNVGPPLQHYALEDITWHCGLPGDRRTDTSLVGNLTLVGIEHEDYPDNKLNANQLHWSTRITKAIRELCPLVGARPPLRRVNLWEHRELSATSCPSGLIPWDRKIALLEDDMDRAQFDKWWGENWGKFVADAPADVPDPIGHLNRYLRGGYPRLQKNVAAAASKGGVLEKVILRLKVLEQLRNPCNFGTDHATMSERMGQYRTAIKALQQEVAALEAGGLHDHEATVNVKLS